MITTIPSSLAFVAFLIATSFLWTFPEVILATSNHGSVTRHYKFDVRVILHLPITYTYKYIYIYTCP